VIFLVIWSLKPLRASPTQKKLLKRSTTPPGRPEAGFKGVGGEMSPSILKINPGAIYAGFSFFLMPKNQGKF
jgi:hypothetical protein